MNAYTPPAAGARPAVPVDPANPDAAGMFWGLQYCRAGMLSLTRLELAMESGDRQRIIEAIDRLHALDGEIERTVAALPVPAAPDPARAAIEEYLGREKMAVAFEKLVLASGISGPGIASPAGRPPRPHAPAAAVPAHPDAGADALWPALEDAPPFAARPAGFLAECGAKAAILLAIVAATGATLAVAL
ncbi:hypothetical protein [Sphingopyxis macrogoltabida]|uniref:Uncharacterized protein n=1 Tax=Sphingopyxis macrogoltabida TaxID=33050 RepID=A0AAC9FFB3_SPHMC|nr:hypothetical protein [Sphingopyxis macrogoltabida]ALJ13724.1 hypothetical protein LH19_12660 [Sphingopyxis macrogoltabida]AMU88833.1 hypothetical protein ATM17_07230 [Sphingopyxis macrogoltabida]